MVHDKVHVPGESMYISVTNKPLKQSIVLQLSCTEFSKNVHRLFHIYHLVIVLVGVYCG